MSNIDVDVLITLVSVLLGAMLGGCVIAYRLLHTLKMVKAAMADGKLSNEELQLLFDELLSYRKLLGL